MSRAGKLAPEVNRALFVKNLSYNVTPEELFDLFGKFGPVRQIRQGIANATKGTAFVVFEDVMDAKQACDKLNGFNFQSRYLVELKNGLKVETQYEVDCDRKTKEGDTVSMHYKGTLKDGSEFDSNQDDDEPFKFKLGAHEVIRGWEEGLLDMCPEERRKLTIPPQLAYGHKKLPGIPPDSTLTFETNLVEIDGVTKPSRPNNASEPSPSATDDLGAAETIEAALSASSKGAQREGQPADENSGTDPEADASEADNGQCKLLGKFALFVQAGLGLLAMVSLVWKRYRERPRRPMKVWFFDVSKQVFGSALLHLANVAWSMLAAGPFDLSNPGKQVKDSSGYQPNPCSFYLVNIAVDTTLGIPILVLALRVLQRGAQLTPLARPPESIKSGNYGQPPRATWWLKQSVIYFLGLLIMKVCVLFVLVLLPWIAKAGDWALKWTQGSEALQIAFVMFVFPLIMNAMQYYIIDSFIKDSTGNDQDGPASRTGHAQNEDAESHRPLRAGGDGAYDRSSLDSSTPRNSEEFKRASRFGAQQDAEEQGFLGDGRGGHVEEAKDMGSSSERGSSVEDTKRQPREI
ncbi:MAG: hypothetical protein M1831_001213 [Alyxoria varia]|nr:MAG: hypothetical protein M1831_001213 [Alyxoria varia]